MVDQVSRIIDVLKNTASHHNGFPVVDNVPQTVVSLICYVYGCLKDVFCMLWMFFVCYGYLKDIFCVLWMSQRCLLYVMDVLKMSFVCYGCLKDVFCMIWMS